MIPEQIINALLQADAAVGAIVSTGNIFPAIVPEGTPLPALAYRRIDAVQLHRPLAVTAGATTLCRARMRVAMLTPADDYVMAKELTQAARRAASNKVGAVAGFTGVHVGPPMASPELPDPVKGMTIDAFDVFVTYREPLT